MKSTGIVRELDALGRIVLPKSLRSIYDLKEKDGMEIFTDGDAIILKKYVPFCTFCSSTKDIVSYREKNICKNCLKALSEITKE